MNSILTVIKHAKYKFNKKFVIFWFLYFFYGTPIYILWNTSVWGNAVLNYTFVCTFSGQNFVSNFHTPPPMQALRPAHLLVYHGYELQLSQLAQAEKFLTCFGEVPSLITAGPPSILTEVFSGYSLSLSK